MKRRTFIKSCAAGALAIWGDGWLNTNLTDIDDLERDFRHPPPSAGPHNWWHWMNGNISEIGITRDLEATMRVGEKMARRMCVHREGWLAVAASGCVRSTSQSLAKAANVSGSRGASE